MRAIVFATKMGGGHMSAAYAVADALKARGCDAEVCDFLTLSGPRTSDIVGGAYIKLVQKSPAAFGKIYRAGQFISTPHMKSIVYFANTLYANELDEYICERQPDILITSHIFAAQALTHLRRKQCAPQPTIGIMTDYTCAPFWEETELDEYITPHPLLEGEFTGKQMPGARLHPLGIPVDPNCCDCTDTAKAKRECGLDPGRAHLLVIGGSMGAGNLPRALAALNGLGVQVTCVCGNNDEVRAQLSEEYSGNADMRILGYVKPLFPLMDASDAIISKPGGLTSTEIMTKRKPFIIINPIEGVETRNAEFFERMGMAMYARTDDEIRAYARRVLSDAELRARMRDAQSRNISQDACGRIADFALSLTGGE